MRNLFILGFALAIVAATIGSVYYFYQKQTLAPQPSPESSPPGKFPTLKETTVSVQPQTGSQNADINLGIAVTLPKSGDLISSPVKVSGFANLLSYQVAILVKDANGKILGESKAAACLDTEACPFEASITFPKPTSTTGSIEVYSPSGVEGESYRQIVAVNFE